MDLDERAVEHAKHAFEEHPPARHMRQFLALDAGIGLQLTGLPVLFSISCLMVKR